MAGVGRSACCVVGEECVDHGSRDDDASAEAQRGEFVRLHALIGGGPRDPKDRSSFVDAVRAPCHRQLATRRRGSRRARRRACKVIVPAGGRGRCVRVQGHHTRRWSTTRRAGADRFARRARRSVAVTTDEACGGTSLRALERSGRRCHGATTRPNATLIGCAGSASTSVRLGRVANAMSKTILQPAVSSPGSVRECLPAPGPADLPFNQTRDSVCREVTHEDPPLAWDR